MQPQPEAGGQVGVVLATETGGWRPWAPHCGGQCALLAMVACRPFCCEVRLHVHSCRHLGHPPSGGGSFPERPRSGVCAGQKKTFHRRCYVEVLVRLPRTSGHRCTDHRAITLVAVTNFRTVTDLSVFSLHVIRFKDSVKLFLTTKDPVTSNHEHA